MSFPKNILFSIFILKIFLLQLTNSGPIVVDSKTINEHNRWIDLPEYREYLKQQGKSSGVATGTTVILSPSSTIATTTLANENEGKYEELLSDSPLGPLGQLPAIQLCKETPKSNNIYGHIYCLAMVIMYALFVLSLIIYVLRSIGRISKKTPYGFGSHFELKCGWDGANNEDERPIGTRQKEGQDQLDHIHGPAIIEAYNKGLKGKQVAEYITIIENEEKKKKNGN